MDVIRRYEARLTPLGGSAPAAADDAYAMYAVMLNAMDGESAEQLHSVAEYPLSQHIKRITKEGDSPESLWVVNLIGETAVRLASHVIESMRSAYLESRGAGYSVEVISRRDFTGLDDMLKIPGGDMDCGRFRLRLVSPCGFRSNGEYVLFPSVSLILGSLRRRWGAAFPFFPLDDKEAASALEAGVRITGYRLHSETFRLKNVPVQAFSGELTLNARLAPPMLRVLRALLSFGTLCGVGMKTALGMGGLNVREFPRV